MRNRPTKLHLALLATLLTVPLGCANKIKHMPSTREGAPYSRAVMVGNTLYLAGDGVLNPQTGKAYVDPVKEAHRLMQSVQATLAIEDMTLDDLVYVTIYCSDLSLYNIFNEVYASYFTNPDKMPARAFIGAGSLLLDMHFEMQGIAVRE